MVLWDSLRRQSKWSYENHWGDRVSGVVRLTEEIEQVVPVEACLSLTLACSTDCRSPVSPAASGAGAPPAGSRSR